MGLFGSGDNLAFQITQSGKERDGAVADVVMGLGASVTLPQRKRALCALQGLALTLLVATEHQSTLRWVQIEPDDVPEFLFKVRVIGDLKSFQPMWLDFVTAPNALDRALAHPDFARHGAHAPSDSTSHRPSGSINDRRDLLRWKDRFATSSGCIPKSRYSVAIKTL